MEFCAETCRGRAIKACHMHGLWSCQDRAWHTGRGESGQVVSDGASCPTDIASQPTAPGESSQDIIALTGRLALPFHSSGTSALTGPEIS